MDIYTLCLLLGGTGLVTMAVTGLGRHGHDGHGHAGHGHGYAHGGHATHASLGDGSPHADASHDGGHDSPSLLWQLMSPRMLFAAALGVGVTGVALRPLLGGLPLALAALAGGVAIERFLVQPIWNFTFRFASNPAMTLESAIEGEATVVSAFDASGHGLVAVEVDGQVVQLLGTLRAQDRAAGPRLRAGDTVRIEEVDAAKNRCVVARW